MDRITWSWWPWGETIYKKKPNTVSVRLCRFTSLPLMFEGSICSILLTGGFVSPFNFSLSSGYEVLAHCGVFHIPIVP